MNKDIINSIVLSRNEINHLLFHKKKENLIMNGFSRFECDLLDEKNLDDSLAVFSSYIKKNKLTNIIIATTDILKYIFVLEGDKVSNIRSEVFNNFKNTFDIALSDYYIDYEVYNFDGKKIVFIAGTLKEFLDKFITIFKKYNFKLLSLETEINSIKRIIQNKYNNIILMNIHMREDDTTFLVMQDNILFSFRELNFGYNNIIKFISERLSINEDIVHLKLKEKDFLEPTVLSESIDRLTIEIQRTIDFYNNQYRHNAINKLILTGKLLNINGIEKFLSQFFIIETEKFDISKMIIIDSDKNHIKELEKMKYLAEAIGAGFRESA